MKFQTALPFRSLSLLGLVLLILLGMHCGGTKPPKTFFDPNDIPAAPDYSKLEHWAAHPQLEDNADGTPSEDLQSRQDEAEVDVFFIHPTTFNNEEHWNMDLKDAETNEKTGNSTIKHQASIFNSAGRVFAPRYRQLTYPAFFCEGEQRRTGMQGLVIAYQDVRNAFDYYLEHENDGRPFVIASHSQGTCHAIQLIREKIDGKPLAEQLVTAYLVGWPVQPDTFKVLKPCASPGETGCYNSWCSFVWDHIPDEYDAYYKGAVVTNPVTWTLSEEPSRREEHLGGVLRKYNKIYSQALEARVNGGILWVTKPDVPGKVFITFKNYHIADYNLFWLDVRKNVELRVQEYLANH